MLKQQSDKNDEICVLQILPFSLLLFALKKKNDARWKNFKNLDFSRFIFVHIKKLNEDPYGVKCY